MKYNAVTVTQLNKYLKDRFDEDENLNAILVKGEISNFKNHYTSFHFFETFHIIFPTYIIEAQLISK